MTPRHRDFDRAMGRRNDTESCWSQMKINLIHDRAPRLDHAAEYLHMLALAISNNARLDHRANRAPGDERRAA